MMTLRVKNWNKFQHFKDRKPPWVKVYRSLLDDLDFNALDGEAAKTLVLIWLIAADSFDGELPENSKLAFRLRISIKSLESILTRLSHWLIQDDINVISSGYQLGPPETEKSRDRVETETEEYIFVLEPSARPPDCPIKEIIEIYHQELPTLSHVVMVNPTREGLTRQRWRDFWAAGDFKSKDEGLAVFRNYFRHVAGSKFLTGHVVNGNKRPFLADYEWLVRPTNFAKVVEGKYHREH